MFYTKSKRKKCIFCLNLCLGVLVFTESEFGIKKIKFGKFKMVNAKRRTRNKKIGPAS